MSRNPETMGLANASRQVISSEMTTHGETLFNDNIFLARDIQAGNPHPLDQLTQSQHLLRPTDRVISRFPTLQNVNGTREVN